MVNLSYVIKESYWTLDIRYGTPNMTLTRHSISLLSINMADSINGRIVQNTVVHYLTKSKKYFLAKLLK